jgi:hypothetical protein
VIAIFRARQPERERPELGLELWQVRDPGNVGTLARARTRSAATSRSRTGAPTLRAEGAAGLDRLDLPRAARRVFAGGLRGAAFSRSAAACRSSSHGLVAASCSARSGRGCRTRWWPRVRRHGHDPARRPARVAQRRHGRDDRALRLAPQA